MSVQGTHTPEREAKAEAVRDLALQGYTTRQISSRLGIHMSTLWSICRDFRIDVPADKVVGKTHRHDPDRIVAESIAALEGVLSGLQQVEMTELDPALTEDWADSLRQASKKLSALARKMTKT